MKKKVVWAAVRLTDGEEWIDTSSISILREEAEEKAEKLNNQIPQWAAANIFKRISCFELTEIFC